MTDLIQKLAAATAVTLALGASPALAQDGDWWSDWDADGDGAIAEEEWNEGFGENEAFSTWDEDEDGALSEDEFNAGVFDNYDEDDSGVLEEPELGDAGDDLGDGGFWDV